jgi:hypothetical protein
MLNDRSSRGSNNTQAIGVRRYQEKVIPMTRAPSIIRGICNPDLFSGIGTDRVRYNRARSNVRAAICVVNPQITRNIVAPIKIKLESIVVKTHPTFLLSRTLYITNEQMKLRLAASMAITKLYNISIVAKDWLKPPVIAQ